MATPRILTMRLKQDGDETLVLVEFGTVELERRIPQGQGVVRLSAIFDPAGKLNDVEIITEKT